MDPIDYLNFGKDSSTKFKLKLDNASLKLASPEMEEDTKSKPVTPSARGDGQLRRKPETGAGRIKRGGMPLYHDQDCYIDDAGDYNARMLAARESVQFEPNFGLSGLYSIESTQLKNMQVSIPVVVKTGTGALFHISNNKLAPRKIPAEEFVRMNLSHQNAMLDTNRNGFSGFATRRRRRRTVKGFKK